MFRNTSTSIGEFSGKVPDVRVLVLGASGMLGSALMRVLGEKVDLEVFGSIRSGIMRQYFASPVRERLIECPDVLDDQAVMKMLISLRPKVVINCISLARPALVAGDPLMLIPIYSLLPHRLSAFCELTDARLVHISTDGVFSGKKGGYTEDDVSDARDLYGMSKYLGEVRHPHAICVRTSIVGHELCTAHGLVDSFLSHSSAFKGYSRVIYSGLPTVVLARIVRDVIVPRPDLYGIYHVASPPISKYALLRLVADTYRKAIEIIEDDSVVSDRSLNGKRFEQSTGYVVPDWPQLIAAMHADACEHVHIYDNR